jgi:hypothetical protein
MHAVGHGNTVARKMLTAVEISQAKCMLFPFEGAKCLGTAGQ